MTKNDYIATSNIFPEWLLSVSESLTFIFAASLTVASIVGFCLFCFYYSRLDILLRRAFLSEILRTIVTLLMGVFLFTDFAEGVKALVVIRPWVLLYATYAVGALVAHYMELFGFKVSIKEAFKVVIKIFRR